MIPRVIGALTHDIRPTGQVEPQLWTLASGEFIPWTLSKQFQDSYFATLAGVRVVPVATHPDVQSMGYGARAMKLLLIEYFASGNVKPDEKAGVLASCA